MCAQFVDRFINMPSSKTGPLSLQKTMSVFSFSQSSSIDFINSPTLQSSSSIASHVVPAWEAPGNVRAQHVVRVWHAIKEHKEGLLTMFRHPFFCILNPMVRKIFVAKASLIPSGVKANSTYAVMNGCVVTVRPIHLECVAMCQARW